MGTRKNSRPSDAISTAIATTIAMAEATRTRGRPVRSTRGERAGRGPAWRFGRGTARGRAGRRTGRRAGPGWWRGGRHVEPGLETRKGAGCVVLAEGGHRALALGVPDPLGRGPSEARQGWASRGWAGRSSGVSICTPRGCRSQHHPWRRPASNFSAPDRTGRQDQGRYCRPPWTASSAARAGSGWRREARQRTWTSHPTARATVALLGSARSGTTWSSTGTTTQGGLRAAATKPGAGREGLRRRPVSASGGHRPAVPGPDAGDPDRPGAQPLGGPA